MEKKKTKKKERTIVTLINGDEVDLKELQRHSGWKGEGSCITIFSEKGDKVLTIIDVSLLIQQWIEKEIIDYKEATKSEGSLNSSQP